MATMWGEGLGLLTTTLDPLWTCLPLTNPANLPTTLPGTQYIIWFIHHIILCSINYSRDRHCIYVIAECSAAFRILFNGGQNWNSDITRGANPYSIP